MAIDSEVMFEVGVVEHPATKARLDALAKSVLDTQAEMTRGVMGVGESARISATAIGGVTDQIRQYGQSSRQSIDEIHSAIQRLQAITDAKAQQIVEVVIRGAEGAGTGFEVVEESATQAKQAVASLQNQIQKPTKVGIELPPIGNVFGEIMESANQSAAETAQAFRGAASSVEASLGGVGGAVDGISDAVEGMSDAVRSAVGGLGDTIRDGLGGAVEDTDSLLGGLTANMRNVFKELGDVSETEATRMEKAFEDAISKLPDNVHAQTSIIRQEYQKRVADQAAAFAQMSADMDKAVAQQGAATEKLNHNMAKSAMAVVTAAKGFAHLGLMSEENSEKMIKGLVAIEGATNVLHGSVELLEAFTQGWKAVRQSTEAAANVSKIQSAMMGGQFASLRAYQAQLAQEAVAANTAAGANMRLAASRGVKGVGAAGSVMDLVSGNVGKRATGRAAVTAGGAMTASTAGRAAVTAGGAMTAATAGRAAATAGGAAATGGGFLSASIAGVATGALGSIAAAGAALGAVGLVATELTEIFRGTATSTKSVTGSIASWEASTASSILGMTGLFDSLDSPATKMAQDITRTTDSFIRSIPILGRFAEQINFAGGAIGDFAGLTASTATVVRAERALALQKEAAAKAEATQGVTYRTSNTIGSEAFRAQSQIQRNSADAGGSMDTKLTTELAIQARAAQELARYQKEAAAAATELGTQSRQYQDAYAQVRTYADAVLTSQERQKNLVAEQSRIQLDAATQAQAGITREIELQDAKMMKLRDGYQSAAISFARLGKIEKTQAIRALEFARANGGEGLRDKQKEALRAIGTEEATRFADQGDLAEAKRFGFDRTFASKRPNEEAVIDRAKKQLTAELLNSYAVTVEVKTNQQKIVDEITSKANRIISDQNQDIIRQVTEKMESEIIAIKLGSKMDKAASRANGLER